jgi:hypothetical protein
MYSNHHQSSSLSLHHSRLWAPAFLRIIRHSSLFNATLLKFCTPRILMSWHTHTHTHSSHLSFGLPNFLVPCDSKMGQLPTASSTRHNFIQLCVIWPSVTVFAYKPPWPIEAYFMPEICWQMLLLSHERFRLWFRNNSRWHVRASNLNSLRLSFTARNLLQSSWHWALLLTDSSLPFFPWNAKKGRLYVRLEMVLSESKQQCRKYFALDVCTLVVSIIGYRSRGPGFH